MKRSRELKGICKRLQGRAPFGRRGHAARHPAWPPGLNLWPVIISTFGLPVLLLSLLLPGCGGDTPAPQKDNGLSVAEKQENGNRQKAAQRDDPKALEALQALATELKRDGEGYVSEVSFRGAAIDDGALVHLLGLKRLRSVLLNDTAVTDEGAATLGKLSTLTNLDLRGCKISNAAAANLAGLTNLRALRLSGENGHTTVDDQGLADLGKLTKLKALALDFLWVTEEGLARLDGLKDLEELYLAKTPVGDEELAKLGQFPKLKKLRLSQTFVTGAGLAHLKKLPGLEELDLSECSRLSDDGLAPLAGITQLTRLNLWRVPITDAGVAHLAGLTKMQWLNVDNTQLTDTGLEHLKGMAQLTFLHLGSTAVSDAGLKHLEHLTSLKDLKVSRTAVTADGVEQLQKKLPNTGIQLKYIEGQ